MEQDLQQVIVPVGSSPAFSNISDVSGQPTGISDCKNAYENIEFPDSSNPPSFVIPPVIVSIFYLILGAIFTGLPAIYIMAKYDTNLYWNAVSEHENLRIIFRISLLACITGSTYLGTLTLLDLLQFVFKIVMALTRGNILASRGMDGFKHLHFVRHYFAFPAASFALWIAGNIILGHPYTHEDPLQVSQAMYYFGRISFTLCIVSTLLLVEKLLVQKIAINYHYDYYADRIADNIFAITCISMLRSTFPPQKWSTIIDSEEYKIIAMAIFNGLKVDGRTSLIPSDFEQVLTAKDAEKFFTLMDADGNGDLTEKEIILGVEKVYKDKDLLTRMLASNDELLSRLDMLGLCLVFAMIVVLCLPIFDVPLAGSVMFIVGTVSSVEVLLKGSISRIFGTLIFIFATHPFDVGDVILVNNKKYKVKSIGWWRSSLKSDADCQASMDNSELANSDIINVRRSRPQAEPVTMSLHFSTTREQLTKLQAGLNAFIKNNPRDFQGTVRLDVDSFDHTESMTISFKVWHRSNFQKTFIKKLRHQKFMDNLRLLVKECGIKYSLED